MAKIHAAQGPSAQDRFLNLLKQGILKLDLAELDFGIYRIRRNAPGSAAKNGILAFSASLNLLEDQPLTLRISLPPLENSEARLVWDLRRRWEHLHKLLQWEGVEVVLLRNRAGVGVGLFAAEGFFPDFLLWVKRGVHQVLAFLEPKGLRHQWPEEKFRLLGTELPKWNFSVPICGFILSTATAE